MDRRRWPAVTLKLVARYADAANFGGGNPEVIREKAALLRQHCDAVGRDYAEIIKSTSLNVLPIDSGEDKEAAAVRAHAGSVARFERQGLIGTEDQIVAKVEAALEAGADYIIFYVPGLAYDHDLLRRAEAVAARFSGS